MDADEDDYEKIRLENMRANAELMESLGLGVSLSAFFYCPSDGKRCMRASKNNICARALN